MAIFAKPDQDYFILTVIFDYKVPI
jgi:hypothetical protein